MIPYFPPEGGNFRLSLGLKVLAEENWIEIDSRYEQDLAEKTAILKAHRGQAFQAMPGSESAQREAFDCVATHLTRFHPDRFSPSGDAIFNRMTGETVGPDTAAPLLAISRLVQEDMTILQPSDDGFRLIAGLVAFPTRWDLTAKIGRVLTEIHAPVPGYAEKLARPMDRLFAGLTEDRMLWRTNYSLLDAPELFQPGGHFKVGAGVDLMADTIGEQLWFRVERQTIRRLPDSANVAFTVRIHQARLKDVVTDAQRAADLLSATRAMPVEMKRYKSLPGFEAALTQWLEARTA